MINIKVGWFFTFLILKEGNLMKNLERENWEGECERVGRERGSVGDVFGWEKPENKEEKEDKTKENKIRK